MKWIRRPTRAFGQLEVLPDYSWAKEIFKATRSESDQFEKSVLDEPEDSISEDNWQESLRKDAREEPQQARLGQRRQRKASEESSKQPGRKRRRRDSLGLAVQHGLGKQGQSSDR